MNDYKIVLLGSGGVGKSALTVQFVSGIFRESYDPTIEDFYIKKVRVSNEVRHIEILDTAGLEQFSSMRDLYIKNGDGFVIVDSITNEKSFQDIRVLKEHITRIKPNVKVPLVLVGNKIDLALTHRQVERLNAEMLASTWDCPFYETSAKRNVAVNDAFQNLIEMVARTSPAFSDSKTDNNCCLVL